MKCFLNVFTGWAYDLKTVSDELIRKRAARTGDGSKSNKTSAAQLHTHEQTDKLIWGWDDEDMDIEDKKNALILN